MNPSIEDREWLSYRLDSAINNPEPDNNHHYNVVFSHWRANGSLSTTIYDNAEPLSHFEPLDVIIQRYPHLKPVKRELYDFYFAWNIEVNGTLHAIVRRGKLSAISDAKSAINQDTSTRYTMWQHLGDRV